MKKTKLICFESGCRNYITVYLTVGAGGENCYAYDKKGNFLADLRNKVYYCKKHTCECTLTTENNKV